MAQREALRELQSRLAERLQQARAEPRAASWLAVDCAGHGLLVALPGAGEIFAPVPWLPVAHTRGWFLGVANLRGQLHGVVDLAAFLGLRPPVGTGGAPEAARDSARLVALNPSLGAQCALRVDRLLGLRSAEQLQPEPPAAPGTRPSFAPACWRDAAGREWQEIDLPALARHPQFLDIAA
jgi:twitching motility protein PilI